MELLRHMTNEHETRNYASHNSNFAKSGYTWRLASEFQIEKQEKIKEKKICSSLPANIQQFEIFSLVFTKKSSPTAHQPPHPHCQPRGCSIHPRTAKNPLFVPKVADKVGLLQKNSREAFTSVLKNSWPSASNRRARLWWHPAVYLVESDNSRLL